MPSRKDLQCRIPGWIADRVAEESGRKRIQKGDIYREALKAYVNGQLGELEPIDAGFVLDQRYVTVSMPGRLRIKFFALAAESGLARAELVRDVVYAYLESGLLDELEPTQFERTKRIGRPPRPNRAMVVTHIPKDLDARLRREANRRGAALADLLEEALIDYVDGCLDPAELERWKESQHGGEQRNGEWQYMKFHAARNKAAAFERLRKAEGLTKQAAVARALSVYLADWEQLEPAADDGWRTPPHRKWG